MNFTGKKVKEISNSPFRSVNSRKISNRDFSTSFCLNKMTNYNFRVFLSFQVDLEVYGQTYFLDFSARISTRSVLTGASRENSKTYFYF